MAPTLLTLRELTKSHGGRLLLAGASLGLQAGAKVGLIGDNGSGKSTLLRLVAGLDAPDGGEVMLRPGTRLAYLPQRPTFTEATVGEVLAGAFAGLRRDIAAFAARAAAGEDTGAEQARLEEAGGFAWEHRVERARCQVDAPPPGRAVATLSGGECRRVALARMLLEEPEVVLLDEPTNHLDLETIAWLEGWLAGSAAAAIVVTHDRAFLEAVVGSIAELRLGQLRLTAGGYADYLQARLVEEDLAARSEGRRRRALEAELAWARRAPSARTTKNKGRLQRAEAERAALAATPRAAGPLDLQAAAGPRLGKTILELHEVTVAPGGRPLFAPLTLRLGAGSRWGIVGPNGAGKTTLLGLCQGTVPAASGKVVAGKNTKIATFDQHRSQLDPSLSVRQALVPAGGDHVAPGGERVHVASYLARFAFPPATFSQAVASLSGGERSRLALAKFLLTPANLLLLDEPTNDLDLRTLAVLEDALLAFSGCLLVVSHDRRFLDRVATGILAIVPGGPLPTVQAREGGWTAFAAWQRARAPGPPSAPAAPAVGAPANASGPPPKSCRKLSYREQRELDGIEARIAAAEAEQAEREATLCRPELWAEEGGAAGRAAQADYERARGHTEELYARWEALLALLP